MKHCTRCEGEEYHDGLCKSCFCEVIGKRIRKDLRNQQLIKKHDRLLVKDGLCKQIIREILGGLPVEYVEQAPYDKEILFWTMEDELEQFLDRLFTGKRLDPLGHFRSQIKLFLHVRDKELEVFAQAKHLNYTTPSRTRLAALVGDMEKKYPEVKFSLLKSIMELKEAMEHGTA